MIWRLEDTFPVGSVASSPILHPLCRQPSTDACVKRGTPASFIYDHHLPVATMKQSNIERKMYAELREIRGAIKALQARIDYVLTDLREYRRKDSRAREDETQSYPEWFN